MRRSLKEGLQPFFSPQHFMEQGADLFILQQDCATLTPMVEVSNMIAASKEKIRFILFIATTKLRKRFGMRKLF